MLKRFWNEEEQHPRSEEADSSEGERRRGESDQIGDVSHYQWSPRTTHIPDESPCAEELADVSLGRKVGPEGHHCTRAKSIPKSHDSRGDDKPRRAVCEGEQAHADGEHEKQGTEARLRPARSMIRPAG